MARRALVAVLWTGATALALSACETQDDEAALTRETPVITEEEPARVEPVVEERLTPRPDLFSLQDEAIWDGRPSLGGAWIAHPDVGNPERVEVTDVTSGQSITAALFRREAGLPGPVFQLSADAAQELGAEPGVPLEVEVIAVRPEVVDVADDAAEGDAEEAESNAAEVEDAVDVVAEGEAAAAAVDEAAAPADDEAAEVELASDEAAIAEIAAAIVAAPDPEPAIEAAAPAVEEAEAPQPVAEAVAPAPAAAPDTPFMQVGMFGVPGNAEALVERLQAEGLAARALPAGSLTRVVVGPAESDAELAETRQRLRELGFSDAIAISL
ncbi:SPOR domain-containing protein [Pontivivens ytuae]|uniref:SPOR domain-containing protein n=1 Tax=Pontivivens ytuae TaxID=2789856 RepID=A0A7S9LSS7_9RHOB|nr:SPOR domain-containing protein [Pontivivens ytuae]QPH54629.1 SPOR domain-containing protein [Pontivivens ytuae]